MNNLAEDGIWGKTSRIQVRRLSISEFKEEELKDKNAVLLVKLAGGENAAKHCKDVIHEWRVENSSATPNDLLSDLSEGTCGQPPMWQQALMAREWLDREANGGLLLVICGNVDSAARSTLQTFFSLVSDPCLAPLPAEDLYRRFDAVKAQIHAWDQIRWQVPAWMVALLAGIVALGELTPDEGSQAATSVAQPLFQIYLLFSLIAVILQMNLFRYQRSLLVLLAKDLARSDLSHSQQHELTRYLQPMFQGNELLKTSSFWLLVLSSSLTMLAWTFAFPSSAAKVGEIVTRAGVFVSSSCWPDWPIQDVHAFLTIGFIFSAMALYSFCTFRRFRGLAFDIWKRLSELRDCLNGKNR